LSVKRKGGNEGNLPLLRVTYLDEVNRIPFTPPKVESDTKTGMMNHITPYRRFANTLKYRKHRYLNIF